MRAQLASSVRHVDRVIKAGHGGAPITSCVVGFAELKKHTQ